MFKWFQGKTFVRENEGFNKLNLEHINNAATVQLDQSSPFHVFFCASV